MTVHTTLESCMEAVAWKIPEGLAPFRIRIGQSEFYALAKTAHQAMTAACKVEKCSQQDAWEAMHRLSLGRKNGNGSSTDSDSSPPSTPASSAK